MMLRVGKVAQAIALASALSVLAACGGPSEPPQSAVALPHSKSAADGYGRLAEDAPGANEEHFLQHSYVAESGDVFGPDTVDSRELGEHRMEARAALANLYAAYDAGARAEHPDMAARAQVAYDCWIAALEAGHDRRAETCEAKFRTLMAEFRKRLAVTVVLLEAPDGNVGAVEYTQDGASTLLSRKGSGLVAEEGKDVSQTELSDQEVQRRFGDALGAMPQPPSTYLLYFQLGKTTIIPNSRSELQNIIADVRSRELPELRVIGHTDTLGTDATNESLSRARAEEVTERIRQAIGRGVPIEINYYGEKRLLVETPDNTAEQRNRRVEVNIR